jgi:hypothetical protein
LIIFSILCICFGLNLTDPHIEEKYSACAFLCFLITWFFDGLLSISGILWDNSLAQYLKTDKHYIVWVGLFIIAHCLLLSRYYRYKGVQHWAEKYNKLSQLQKSGIHLLLILTIIAVFIFSFVAYRLYVF